MALESVFVNERVRAGSGAPSGDPGGGSGTLYTDLDADALYVWDSVAGAWEAISTGGGGGITINTTTITGGTTGRVLYDNAGTVGEMTTTGSTTVVVLQTSPTLITPLLGTPTSGDLVNCTGYTVANVAGLGTGVATFLATPSSANLATAVTGETGSGALVFGTSPTFTTSIICASTLNINSSDGGSWVFIPPDGSQSYGMQLAAVATNVVKSIGKVNVGSNTAINITTGTHIIMNIFEGAAPTATSTLVYIPLKIGPTINYSAGTPGAGSYEALKIAITETALPTGTNYLIRASAGAAGTTDKFTVKNDGTVVCANTITTIGGATFHTTSSALTDGAGGSTGTLTTAPAVGNPTKWIGINDNGTTRYVPSW